MLPRRRRIYNFRQSQRSLLLKRTWFKMKKKKAAHSRDCESFSFCFGWQRAIFSPRTKATKHEFRTPVRRWCTMYVYVRARFYQIHTAHADILSFFVSDTHAHCDGDDGTGKYFRNVFDVWVRMSVCACVLVMSDCLRENRTNRLGCSRALSGAITVCHIQLSLRCLSHASADSTQNHGQSFSLLRGESIEPSKKKNSVQKVYRVRSQMPKFSTISKGHLVLFL